MANQQVIALQGREKEGNEASNLAPSYADDSSSTSNLIEVHAVTSIDLKLDIENGGHSPRNPA